MEDILSERLKSSKMPLWCIILIIAICNGASIFAINYFGTKSTNLATKQDIAEITQKVDSVKAEIQKNQDIGKEKHQTKYKALLQSLKIIDAYFSHIDIPGKIITKQNASIEEVRACHDDLLLTCDSSETLNLFTKIMNPEKKGYGFKDNLMTLLVAYRNQVRIELGYGSFNYLDTDFVWIGKINFDK